MTKQLQNELSDAQLDAISGGSYSRDCGDGRHRDNDCDYESKKSCGGGGGGGRGGRGNGERGDCYAYRRA